MQWYSGFFRRFVASIIDVFVIILFIVFIQFILGIMDGSFFNIVIFLMIWSYFAFQESSSRKGTVGKQAMNLIVTDLDGNKISFMQATKRFLGKFLAAVPFFAGFLMMFFTKKKQALHDIIAKTLVFIQED
ncbi:MAG: hypothetical protein QG646_3011 [Euryarchaeota archaeon]|nr:hypothetical protein [Euryarchaeota archaeon]